MDEDEIWSKVLELSLILGESLCQMVIHDADKLDDMVESFKLLGESESTTDYILKNREYWLAAQKMTEDTNA